MSRMSSPPPTPTPQENVPLFLQLAEIASKVGPISPGLFVALLQQKEETLQKVLPEVSIEAINRAVSQLYSDDQATAVLDPALATGDYSTALSGLKELIHHVLSNPPGGIMYLHRSEKYRYLDEMYQQLWNRQDLAPPKSQEALTIPHIKRLPVFFDFNGQPADVVEVTSQPISNFTFLDLPFTMNFSPLGAHGPQQKILVRECYPQLLEAIERTKEHVVVLGQSGIGKSLFLVYVLAERLRRGKPTALQLDKDKVLSFTQRGAFLCPADPWLFGSKVHHSDYFPNGTIFLMDCDDQIPTVSEFAMALCTWVRIVQVCTPVPEHYAGWVDELHSNEYWMDGCSLGEVLAMSHANGTASSPAETSQLIHCYLKYGPNARICLAAASDPEQMVAHEQVLQRALDDIGPTQQFDLGRTIKSKNDALVAIRTADLTYRRLLPASSYALQLLSAKTLSNGPDHLEQFYQTLRPYDEMMMDVCYPFGIPTIQTLSLQGGSFRPRALGNLHGHQSLDLEVLGGDSLLRFSCNDDLKGLISKRGRVLVPTHAQYSTVDAVVVTESGMVWLLQVTTGSERPIDHDTLEILALALPGGRRKNLWHVLFMVPKWREDRLREAKAAPGGKRKRSDDDGIPQFIMSFDPNGTELR